jgi:hypothetical protein
MTALVIALDLLVSLICWLISWQLIRLQPQIVALVVAIDDVTIAVEQLGVVPALLADRQQQIQQFQQLYQQPLTVLDQARQLVRLLLWVGTRR